MTELKADVTLKPCTLGVGCDESGVCYASAHNQPEMCGREEFEREERYIVIKRKNLAAVDEKVIRETLGQLSIPTVECVVVESDWPEYETVWQMIETRCTGNARPADDVVDAFGKAADIVQSRYDKAPWNNMGDQFAAAIDDLRALAALKNGG